MNKKEIKVHRLRTHCVLKKMSQVTITLEVDQSCSIEELKKIIDKQLHVSVSKQKLIFNGHVLRDSDIKTVSECGIRNTYGNNAIVHLVIVSGTNFEEREVFRQNRHSIMMDDS